MNALESTELLVPATLAEALRMQADPATRATPLAGGTDLMVQWEAAVRPPPARAISVKLLAELRGIRDDGPVLDIGAAVTHAELRRSPLVRASAPSLAAAASEVGGAQIQALGTIGGSIANASPAGDLAPSLLVAEADVVVASVRGERCVPMTSFVLGYRKIDLQPDELIVRFRVPKLPESGHEGWRKLGPRAAQAISKVMGSYRAVVRGGRVMDIRIALGSVAPTAVRLRGVEGWLKGRGLDAETFSGAESRAAAEVNPIADIRSTAEYRRWVSGRLVRGFVESIARPAAV